LDDVLRMPHPDNSGALTPADFHDADPRGRRCEERIDHRRMIQVLPTLADEEWKFLWAELIDCSPHGMGLFLKNPLKPGSDFLVKLRLDSIVLLLYTVRHCEAEGKGWRIGARFTGVTGDPIRRDPQTVLDALLKPDPPEAPPPN
jgi:hypothetical protein